jgi:hypothetical protein
MNSSARLGGGRGAWPQRLWANIELLDARVGKVSDVCATVAVENDGMRRREGAVA